MSKADNQYRLWVFAAILKARKSPNRQVLASEVATLKIPHQHESFRQWAIAEGWLHGHGECVYEGKKTRFLNTQEVHAQLFNH